MHHLLLGIDPVELGQAPFALATVRRAHLGARETSGLRDAPDARVYLLPCIAGHVGADAAAVGAVGGARHRRPRTDADRRCRHQCRDPAGRHRPACSPAPRPPAPPSRARRSVPASAPPPAPSNGSRSTRRPRSRASASSAASCGPTRSRLCRGHGGQGVTGICGSGIIEAVAEMRMAGLVDASGLIGSAARPARRAAEPGRADPCLPAP
jgi:hypothetical protein